MLRKAVGVGMGVGVGVGMGVGVGTTNDEFGGLDDYL